MWNWRGREAGAMPCTMPSDPVFSELLERCPHDHEAWSNGNGAPYSLLDDGTILGAIGGYARGGSGDCSATTLGRAARAGALAERLRVDIHGVVIRPISVLRWAQSSPTMPAAGPSSLVEAAS